MNLKKIPALFLFLVFSTVLLPADWHEVVKRHLGTFLVYDRLVIELSARFEEIEKEEKGAAALILAYSFEQIKKKSVVSPLIRNFYDKSAALARKEVSTWLKKYFEEFRGRDDGLLFLSPDREAVRNDILLFRNSARDEFPLIEAAADILDLESFVKIKLRIDASAACGYEIYDKDSALLVEGILKKGINKRIVQVKKKAAGRKKTFIRLLVFNRYINEQKIAFGFPGTPAAVAKKRPPKNSGWHMFANLPAGASFFLLNTLLVDRQYGSDTVQPGRKAVLGGSGKVLEGLSFALIAKGLIDLCKRKGYCENGAFKKKPCFGFFWSPLSRHDYYVYRQGQREPAARQDTSYFEQELTFSMLLKQGIEMSVFYRKFRADNISIAGGLWSTSRSLTGITLGKAVTLSDPGYQFPLDFFGGAFAARNYSQQYTFLGLKRDERVVSEYKKLTYGLYTGGQLRLNILRKIKRPEMPVITIGFKYFFPFNNFEYGDGPGAVYRLHKKFFYIGFYFR